MPRACSFAGLILAAGASSRMGKDKALLDYQGHSFLAGAIDLLKPVSDLVIVVAGANCESLRPIVDRRAAYLVENPTPERGQFSSLRVGLDAILGRGRDAVMLTLVDRPPAEIETVVALKCEFLGTEPHETWAVVPEFQGKHGHPVLFGREMMAAFLRAPEDATARDVEHANQARIRYVTVADAKVVLNINTPEEYAQLSGKQPLPS
jgi:molybdenum cofactor cytidylyltransferase